MERFMRRRTLYVQRRFLFSFIAFLFAFALAVPALAEFLGPDRTTTQFVTVRDPDNDVWTLTHVDPLDPYSDVCLIVHTCDEHPSVGRQTALCGWVADNSGCSMAYKTEEQTVTLAEATISDGLQNCNLNNGWCTSSPTLHLTANEPLPGETITLIEGTRNGEAFACASDTCDVPLVEGNNSFSFWALSSYGDSSQMGNISTQVDTVPPASAFGSPPEGSSVWVSGVLNMSGSSTDASSGVASAEISLNGGGSWQGLSLAGNSWGYSWDTGAVPDGSYQVLVRASDIAGHLESTANITVHVDQTAPSANLPDEWLIWEPVAIGASDGGSGVEAVELTIHGGLYGVRKYKWSSGSIPGSFIWDRFFGSTVAPIGEYEVILTVWDALGNSGSDSGTIVIPATPTDEPEPTSIPPTEPPATSTPHATATSGAAGFAIVSTATFTASSGGGPAAAPLDDSAAPAALADPEATSPTSGPPGGLLWGGAALAAAAAATAYALDRRRRRQAEIERMRRAFFARSSPEVLEARLNRLRRRAEASIAPAQAMALEQALNVQAAKKPEGSIAMPEDDIQRLWDRLGEFEAPNVTASELAEKERIITALESRLPEGGSADTPTDVGSSDQAAVPDLRSPDRIVADQIRDGIGIAEVIGSLGTLAYSARQVDVVPLGSELRIYGSRAARTNLGFNPYTNTIGAQNEAGILQSPFRRTVSPGWAIVGLVTTLGYNTYMHLTGRYDRFEYAAALTVDTGATAATVLGAGFLAGSAAGFVAGMGVASLPAAIVGGVVGAGVAYIAMRGFDQSGVRDFLVDKVADLFSGWKRP